MSGHISSNKSSPEAQASPNQGITIKVLRGGFWTLLSQSLPLAASFVATPFVIRLLGTESYGTLALINLLPAYFYFTDFGMGVASTKFGSEAFSKSDSEKEGKAIRTALIIALTVTIPLIILLVTSSNYIVTNLLNIPEHLRFEANIGLKIVAIGLLFKTLIGILNTPQLVRLEMKLNALTSSIFSITQLIVTPIALYLGFNLIAVFLIVAVSAFLQVIATSIISYKFLRNLFSFTVDRTLVKPLLTFGGNWMISSIAATILVNSEKFILSQTVSVKALAYYSVAVTLSQITMMLSGSVIQSLVPAFARLNSSENAAQLKQLYFRILRLNLIFLPPLLICLAVIAKPFFTIWAGAEYGRQSSLPFYILLTGLLFNILAFAPNSLLTSFGKMNLLAKVYWIELIPYLGLVYFLTLQFGLIGAAIAWSIRTFADAFVQFILANRTANIKKIGSNINLSKMLCLYLILLPCVFLILFLKENLMISIIITLLLITVYFVVSWAKIVSVEEKQWIYNRHTKMLKRS